MKRIVLVALAILLTVFLIPLVPEFLKSVDYGDELAAPCNLKIIYAAQETYYQQTEPHSYADGLEILGATKDASEIPLISSTLATGEKSGYRISLVPGPSGKDGCIHTWSCTVWPVVYLHNRSGFYGRLFSHGFRSFYIDETGIIRCADNGGRPGSKEMPAID